MLMCCLCGNKSFLPVCLYISLLMISEDDQFHHLEERIGPRKRGRPQHLRMTTEKIVFSLCSADTV